MTMAKQFVTETQIYSEIRKALKHELSDPDEKIKVLMRTVSYTLSGVPDYEKIVQCM